MVFFFNLVLGVFLEKIIVFFFLGGGGSKMLFLMKVFLDRKTIKHLLKFLGENCILSTLI